MNDGELKCSTSGSCS